MKSKNLIIFFIIFFFAQPVFSNDCDITLKSNFKSIEIYDKDSEKDVYALLKNGAGRYEATFELYNVKGCREVDSGTMSSYSKVVDKISEYGYESVILLPSGLYKDLSGDLSMSYTVRIDDEIKVDFQILSEDELYFINHIIMKPDSLGVEGGGGYRDSIIFDSPRFWSKLDEKYKSDELKNYYRYRWTLNKTSEKDIEEFLLLFNDEPDWEFLVGLLMRLKYGELTEDEILVRYAQEYSQSNYAQLAIDILDKKTFKRASQLNTIEGYEDYLAKFKKGVGRDEALMKVTNLMHMKYLNTALNSSSIDQVVEIFSLYPNDSEIKAKMISLYREEHSLEGYKKAYQYSGNDNDLIGVLKYSNTIVALEEFLNSYPDKEIATEAKGKLVVHYREKNTFDSYLEAYKLLSVANDGFMASKKAKTLNEKGRLEEAAFLNIPRKSVIIDSDISLLNVSYTDYERTGGFLSFVKYVYRGVIKPSIKLSVDMNKDLAFKPKFGVYVVTVNLSLTVPRSKQVRSEWVGNSDESEDVQSTKAISFVLEPPYSKNSQKTSMDETIFVYFDRGDAGGFTAKWPSDDAYISIDSVNVRFNGIYQQAKGELDIDFSKLNILRGINKYEKINIDGSFLKGSSMINAFAEVDSHRVDRAQSNNSSTVEPAPLSSPSPRLSSSSSSSSSTPSRGIRDIKSNGRVNGGVSYRVNCTGGSSYIIYEKNSSWYLGHIGSMGAKYNRWTKERVGEYLCK